MTEQTIQLALILAFLAVAMIGLGASAFIRLVALLLENGSKVGAVLQEIQQVRTHLSLVTGTNTSSPAPNPTPTTQETVTSTSRETSTETKSQRHS